MEFYKILKYTKMNIILLLDSQYPFFVLEHSTALIQFLNTNFHVFSIYLHQKLNELRLIGYSLWVRYRPEVSLRYLNETS